MAIYPEQIYCIGVFDNAFYLSGKTYDTLPWHHLAKTVCYCLDEDDMHAVLVDAVTHGYQILEGARSDRRGLRGFKVGVGPWGCAGSAEVLTVDAWCLQLDTDATDGELVAAHQDALRRLCRRLNAEEATFRSSALRWLGAIYYRMGRLAEPGSCLPPPLPRDVAKMTRAAHIGGPIVHARSTLEPFVSIDRHRAYGEVLRKDLPCGEPTEIDLTMRPLHRWHSSKLRRLIGFAEATVKVFPGPMVPLLPVLQAGPAGFDRTKTLYPTGTLRGTWSIAELAFVEETNRGEIEDLHRVVIFESARPFEPMIFYLRDIEKDIPYVKMKRLEHMLYGSCARNLHVTRFASVAHSRDPMPTDILDNSTIERLTTRVEMRPFGLRRKRDRKARRSPPRFPLYEVNADLTEGGHGTMDRPDRSAWVTSMNRIEICRLIDTLDEALQPERSGDYIGRIFVDGIDIEARPEDIPKLRGASIRGHGPKMHILRAGAVIADLADGTTEMSATGIELDANATRDDFVRQILMAADPDGGPLAGGRHWEDVPGVDDPRTAENQISHPLHFDIHLLEALGMCESS